MRAGILDRYLLREAGGAWLAVTLVLLAIMLSTRFARFLGEAASGILPRDLLFEVVALSSLQYLAILVPASLLLAVMLALGRLYKDNEVAAMSGCGVSMAQLYRPFLVLGVLLSLFTAALTLFIGPWAGRTAEYISKDAARFVQYNPFEAGHFKDVAGGRATVYTAEMDAKGQHLGSVFARIHEKGGDTIVVAKGGTQIANSTTGERVVTLTDGYRYRGEAGQAQFDIMRFAKFSTRIQPPDFVFTTDKRRLYQTSELWNSPDPQDQAELQWRLAAPISVLVLVLLAVPLSHIGPRQGRYGKLVIGILIYLVYTQLIAMGQAWIAKGHLSPQVGLWWAHALMLGVALTLIVRRSGLGRRA
ncbi:MAG TPA: LPS export ABC transporter permease LptF [Stenotrophobium sp.]|jgi:lipopolysaccharide export system permease protein|nr:LPS export ABC transporter permease LptF [Stenotrophobium sp.]